MTDTDFETFSGEVKRLAVVMRLRAAPLEVMQITKAYFTAFKRFPMSVVVAGADRWIEQGDRFPKAKQWLDAMPAPGETRILELLQDEADDWLAAERAHFQRSPCRCLVCVGAGVSDQPQRFIPDCEPDGRDAHARIGDRVITRGRWAHGEELAGWYAARAAYVALLERLPRLPKPMPAPTRALPMKRGRMLTFKDRIDAIFRKPKEREPGEEG